MTSRKSERAVGAHAAPAASGRTVTRRAALAAGAGLGAAGLAGCGPAEMGPPAPTGLFRHGVASGDPRADSVLIWTRLTQDGEAGPADVDWEVAEDDAFTSIIARGAARARLARDFTIKAVVDGLAPGTVYYYRFRHGETTSDVGRMRTLPTGALARYRIALVSCANYPAGFFNVYRDLAGRDDIDAALCVGDYIYEYGPGEYATDWGAKHGRVPDPPHEIVTLDDYRGRYAQYRSDVDLQAAHAAHTWICTWDDHETANDSWSTGAENHQPEEGEWSARRRAAMRAYYDWMPVRDPEEGAAREHLWRTYELGDLATLILLETRLSGRDPQPDWSELEDVVVANRKDPALPELVAAFNDEVVDDPAREMLGAAQMRVVTEALAASTARGARWQVLANQVIMGRARAPDFAGAVPGWLKAIIKSRYPSAWAFTELTPYGVPLNTDAWDGYPAARERLFAAAEAAGAKLLTLTGDTHYFSMNALRTAGGKTIGAEFGGSSVTSPSSFEAIPRAGVDYAKLIVEANPDDVFHMNIYDRGYVVVTLTPDDALGEFVRVDTVKSRTYASETYIRWSARPTADGVAIEEA